MSSVDSLPAALARLSDFRQRNARESRQVFEDGLRVLGQDIKAEKVVRKGDDVWPLLEQLFLAAIDVGSNDIAERCLSRLTANFPESPRVDCLVGIYKEATESPRAALAYYDELLVVDESNAAAWKRKISLLRRTGQISRAVEELSQFLDTYYSDVDGWLELADVYASCSRYSSSLQSLQHALLLAPQNPSYVLLAGETAFTLSDSALALKYFLLAVELSDASDPLDANVNGVADSVPEGVTVRAWYGVKSCTRRLLSSSPAPSSSRIPRSQAQTETPVPSSSHLKLLDELATERLLTSYSGGDPSVARCSRDALVKWLEVSN